ncbi:MAG: type II toxin-antitoxin system death-on-curing family toxin [Candidatus Aenigmarchaeota archaeon]|nr:type II toxin-antitoxin system death-on-curing family toxin [Candidatus Aenigmarchaeota archaeon]
MIINNNITFCFRCYHTWKKRKENNPKNCPKCKSPYWNRPRKRVSKQFVIKMQETIINIHNTIIKISGGDFGIREEGGIYNSTYKLLQKQETYKRNPIMIGAFILDDFARRHFFVDGNKRTAYVLAKIFMLINKCHLKIDYSEATQFILQIAKFESQISFDEIKDWLSNNCIHINEKDIETYLNKVFVNITLKGVEDANKNRQKNNL